ncbi:hypothetical protein [Rheinheimera soli]|uniref:Uncharacterized protein n=1 Tax=Rheinheimera soli TaxID=443616 RepID=A0ABU1W5A2_9GAMM|nr:hypothetical protein [Rheinheimera soli]MDR7123134.1 hypothetical protein [Rheinheimera soli]
MTKAEKLMASFASAVKAGAGVYTSAKLAYMMNKQQTTAFTKFLADWVKEAWCGGLPQAKACVAMHSLISANQL